MSESKELHILSNFEIFKGLTSSDLEDIHAHCQKIVFKETDILIREGQTNSTLSIIIKGQVEVILPGQDQSKEYKRATKVKLSILDEGDFFGEYSLIDSGRASASVVARQPGELIKISKLDLDNVLKSSDRIASTIYHNMLQIMIRRLRDVNKEYDEVFIL
jgi:CRP-like cAMP-binding protein